MTMDSDTMRYDPAPIFDAARADGRPVPAVIGQIGQTLDGKVATPTGKSLYINGKCALAHLHRLRASVDALIVGVETVIADDPRLTVRMCDGPSPVRVVIDPKARIPSDSRILHDEAVETLLIHASDAGVTGPNRIVIDREADRSLAPHAIIAALSARGYRRILVEGGPTTLSRFLNAGALDELHVMVAPKIFGSGREGITLPPIDSLDDALTPTTKTWLFDDGDVLFHCDLTREPKVG